MSINLSLIIVKRTMSSNKGNVAAKAQLTCLSMQSDHDLLFLAVESTIICLVNRFMARFGCMV